MRIINRGIAAAGLIALAACGQDGGDQQEQAQEATENHADVLEGQAEATNNQAAEQNLQNLSEEMRAAGENGTATTTTGAGNAAGQNTTTQ